MDEHIEVETADAGRRDVPIYATLRAILKRIGCGAGSVTVGLNSEGELSVELYGIPEEVGNTGVPEVRPCSS